MQNSVFRCTEGSMDNLLSDKSVTKCSYMYCALESTLTSFNLHSSKPQLLWRVADPNQQRASANYKRGHFFMVFLLAPHLCVLGEHIGKYSTK